MEIAARMSADARAEFAAMLERHRGLVLKVAGSYARDRDERADLAQEIATQLWLAWPTYDPARALSTWMYRIALNVAISHLRGRSRRDAHLVPLEEGTHDPVDERGGPEEAQQLSLLERVIAGFDPLDRALLLLYLDERSQREIADVLGISETNVSTKISRLKHRIRNELS